MTALLALTALEGETAETMPTTSVSRIIAAPQEEVWAALADIAKAGRWNTAWVRIEITSPQQHGAGTTFRAHTADGHSFDFEVTHWAPPSYIAFAPIRRESERYEITMQSHAFLLRPIDDSHTQVELIASATCRGIRGRLVGLFLWPGHQKQGLNAALDALQALFEPLEPGASEAEPSSTTD